MTATIITGAADDRRAVGVTHQPARMAAVDKGAGNVVVLLHGFPGNAQDWEAVAAALEQDFRVIVPDLLGFGRSDAPGAFAGLTITAQADALERLLAERGVARCVLVGQDYGGPIAVTLAARRPDLVAGLVLSSCNFFRDPALQAPMKLLPVPGIGRAVEAALFSPPSLRYMARNGTRRGKRLPAVNSPSEVASIRTIFATMLRDLPTHFGAVEDALPALTVPVLVAWGDRDPFFDVPHARRSADAIPGARLRLYEGAGHFPHLEVTETYARDIATLGAAAFAAER